MKHSILAAVIATLWGVAALGYGFDNYQQAFNAGQERLNQKDYEQARGAFAEAVKLSSAPGEFLNAQLYVGHACLAAKNYAAARAAYQELLKDVAAASPAESMARKANAFIATGDVYLQEQKYPEALQEYSKILNLSEPHAVYVVIANTKIGQIREMESNYPAAIEAYQRILSLKKIGPDQKEQAQNAIAKLYFKEKNYDDAGNAYRQLLKLVRTNPKSKFDIWTIELLTGNVLRSAKKYAAARQQYQKVLEAEGVPAKFRTAAQRSISDVYLREQDYAAFALAYRKIFEMEQACPTYNPIKVSRDNYQSEQKFIAEQEGHKPQ